MNSSSIPAKRPSRTSKPCSISASRTRSAPWTRTARPIKTIGLAPLTSMFWFGKNSERKFDDYRPEVHDSDGLLIHMDNGEVFWRPLDNPPVMRHQVFHAPNIRGFGLLQRERTFRRVSGHVQPLPPGAERLGGAARQLGRRRRASGGIEHQLRGPGQHRRVLGSEKQSPRRCNPSVSATRFTGRAARRT